MDRSGARSRSTLKSGGQRGAVWDCPQAKVVQEGIWQQWHDSSTLPNQGGKRIEGLPSTLCASASSNPHQKMYCAQLWRADSSRSLGGAGTELSFFPPLTSCGRAVSLTQLSQDPQKPKVTTHCRLTNYTTWKCKPDGNR